MTPNLATADDLADAEKPLDLSRDPPTEAKPHITVDGDPEGGFIVSIHDGNRLWVYSPPEGTEDADAAKADALDQWREDRRKTQLLSSAPISAELADAAERLKGDLQEAHAGLRSDITDHAANLRSSLSSDYTTLSSSLASSHNGLLDAAKKAIEDMVAEAQKKLAGGAP